MTTSRSDLIWPGAVVGLILLGMATTFGMLFASRVDGGPEVIEAYYDKAVAWDSTAAVRAASDDLGWHASVSLVTDQGTTPRMVLSVRDADGQPVEGLTGSAILSRPQRAVPLETLNLAAGDAPGAYVSTLTVHGTGLFDIALDLSRDDDRFVRTIRAEWHLP